ncbi:hypothetical protein IW261DRAFT_1576248 [Armillaria novae-zelandiae]|uniref:Uncharacterized protein n=1 Tax=Armillaria novae-zelandiae TaxID=153914 RepID=A0AA39TT16_9AGAR|nr:hypothetical protein IW261DRAFT_1576248 [Armillaria novae-zelandiae]
MPTRAPTNTSAMGPQRPKLTLLGPRLPVATLEPSFSLDPTLPLHPAALLTGAMMAPNPFLSTRRSQNVTPANPPPLPSCSTSPIHANTPPALSLPDPVPSFEGIIVYLFHKGMPLFFLGTDDEDESLTQGANDKGKGRALVPGTDKDEGDFSGFVKPLDAMVVDDNEDGSPPPTLIARCYRSPIFLGANPLTVSELLGAPSAIKPKKTYKVKAKFNNPPPAPNDSAVEVTVTAKWSSKKVSKALKEKQAIEVPPGEVVATKVNPPRGPSQIRPPLATLGVQGGGFGEEVPAGYMAIINGLKTIGVLVVSWDFGDFVEVDKVLWNKKVAPFIVHAALQPVFSQEDTVLKVLNELGTVPALNPLRHYRPKEYTSLNAFEGAIDTLAQHATALEDLILNYLAGLDAMSQLQGLCTQIGHLRKCLGSDSRVGEIAEDDDKGYAVDEVAEGDTGPSKKCKQSCK